MPIRLDGDNATATPGITGGDADTGFVFGTNEIEAVTGGTTRFTVESNGNVTIENGNLVLASGSGIDFSATGDGSGTTTSELLDDYEEGTFTPVFINVAAPTYTSRGGSYVKNGKIVLVTLDIQYTGLTRSDASAMAIAGLPFTAGTTDTGTVAGGGFCTGGAAINFAPASHGETAAVYGQIATGGTSMIILGLGNSDSFDYRDCAQDGRIRMIGTYIAN